VAKGRVRGRQASMLEVRQGTRGAGLGAGRSRAVLEYSTEETQGICRLSYGIGEGDDPFCHAAAAVASSSSAGVRASMVPAEAPSKSGFHGRGCPFRRQACPTSRS
jgi:hypothetical protein